MEISFSLSSKARYYSIAKIFLLSMVTVKVQVFFKKKLLHVGYNYNSKPLDTELRLLIIAAIRYITFLISTSKNLLYFLHKINNKCYTNSNILIIP